MRENILSSLSNRLIYMDAVVVEYHDVASVRLQNIEEHKKLMASIVNNKDGMLKKVLLDVAYCSELEELKRLDLMNLRAWVKGNINPHMKEYLQALIAEREKPSLLRPSSELRKAEYEMFQYLLGLSFDEDLEHVLYVANMTLRFVLQEWLLCPELVCDKISCYELLDALDLSNCKL